LNTIFTIILVLFITFTLISLQKIYNLETERFAVIMTPSVTLLAEPKLGGTEVFVLHEGTKVKIERQNQDWYEIRLEDGKTGWIETTKIEII
jgi:SH3-like domain-containing protein